MSLEHPAFRARSRIAALIVVLSAVVFVAVGATVYALYRVSFEQSRMRLVDAAKSRARLIEAVARFDAVHHDELPGGAFEATLSQVREAHDSFRGFGETGEFTLARREGDRIDFLVGQRHDDTRTPRPVPWETQIAAPMRRALSGESGTVIGPDYRGVRVLAAHEPVDAYGMGIVAKIDLAELRAPFLRVGALAAAGAFLLVLVGARLFLRISRPVVSRLEAQNEALAAEVEERRRAESEARASEERLRTTLDSIGDAVIATDASGAVARMNPVAEQLTGWREPAAMGRPLAEVFRIITEETRAEVESPVEKVLREGRTVGLANHTLLIARDGREVPIADSGAPIRGSDGATTGVVLVFRDQGEERAAERELAKRERRYRLLADNTLDVIWTMAPDLTFTYVNPAVESMTGYTPEEWVGTVLGDHCDDESMALMTQVIADEMAKGPESRGVIFEVDMLRKDGSPVPAEIHGRVMFDEHGKPALLQGLTRDISERRRAEREQEALREQLAASQRMESIGMLAGGIAHDFNNLLSVILSYTGFAMDAHDEDDPVRDDLAEVTRAAEQAASLTRQLLAFSRRLVLEPVVVNLNEVVSELGRMLQRVIGEHVELEMGPAADLGNARVDPGQMEQVLMNLAVNARDAMPDGGRLTIETRNTTLDAAYADAHVELEPGDYVVLSVSDSGYGMDAGVRAKVFEPFFSTKGRGRGTGLGLSTVYGIVKQSGGHISIYSEPGEGTTVKVYLPRVPDEVLGSRKRPEVAPPTGDETVLVVEDEEAVRRMAARILASAGYTVLEAASGDAALTLCERHRNGIDLLVTDVVMPRMSGKELAERLGRHEPELKVLYMSGYTDDAIVHHGVLEPGTAFIGKPFGAAEFIRKVREVLDGRED